jgi:hypothetical protein
MKESEFIKFNFKFEISNFCTNVKAKIAILRTAVRQLTNTLTVLEFSKWIVELVTDVNNSVVNYNNCVFHFGR